MRTGGSSASRSAPNARVGWGQVFARPHPAVHGRATWGALGETAWLGGPPLEMHGNRGYVKFEEERHLGVSPRSRQMPVAHRPDTETAQIARFGAWTCLTRAAPDRRLAEHRARSATRSKPVTEALRGSGRSTWQVDESATGSVNFLWSDSDSPDADSPIAALQRVSATAKRGAFRGVPARRAGIEPRDRLLPNPARRTT